MKLLRAIGHLIITIFLTALTQVGGLIWLLVLLLASKFKLKKRYLFPMVYLVFNLLLVPPVAKYFGREQLPVFDKDLKPRHYLYPLLFRNYVVPEMKTLLEQSAEHLKYQSIGITYLDANFPFLDGFPLLPHLSHSDGKKIDLSFQYVNSKHQPTDKKPSLSGYGVFALSEQNFTSNSCIENGYWQYDYSKYLTFGTINDLNFDSKNTKLLIQELLKYPSAQKLFIEPHLKQSLGLGHMDKIRFHGCQAVRHDDHIHLQIR
ncbi:hypothetical protein [uncultured Psychroserpens sp.]|uniref:hypothetical protein n=1 Tax=uncultured Psychroserpens sp. TaxID=255436 RepID=UPI00260F80CB|nr:hypothetical protein [uncultured Psychroserpens sp.]